MNLYPIILAAVFLAGLGVTAWGWRVLQTSRQKRAWPTVAGRIEESEPHSAEDELLPHIVYAYEVAGQTYRCRFEFPADTNPMPEFAAAYVKKYPAGARVTVYYQTQQPQQSTLEPGARGDWMILALGLMMAAGAAVTLLVSR